MRLEPAAEVGLVGKKVRSRDIPTSLKATAARLNDRMMEIGEFRAGIA
jgi:hypothetical protein